MRLKNKEQIIIDSLYNGCLDETEQVELTVYNKEFLSCNCIANDTIRM